MNLIFDFVIVPMVLCCIFSFPLFCYYPYLYYFNIFDFNREQDSVLYGENLEEKKKKFRPIHY